MIRIVALSREYGSGGAVIASEVGSILGWELIDRAFIERIAAMAGVTRDEAVLCDERVASWVERLTQSLWTGSPGTYVPGRPDVFDPDRMQALAQQVVLQVAEHTRGAVIVGRGSQCILHRRDDVLSIFVYAPFEQRLRRLRPRFASEDDAIAEIERMESERTQFIRHYFGWDRSDRNLYHLMINSSIGVPTATNLIVDTVRRSQRSMAAAAGPQLVRSS